MSSTLVTLAQVKAIYPSMSDADATLKISAVESFIKAYTSNTFKDRTTGEVDYPPDVTVGALNLIIWNEESRELSGISSETLSRHSITYVGQSDYVGGYPNSMIGFLNPYIKARF